MCPNLGGSHYGGFRDRGENYTGSKKFVISLHQNECAPHARFFLTYCSENSPKKPKIRPKNTKYHYSQRKTHAADEFFVISM